MGQWGEKIREILSRSNINTYLEMLYVDDCRFVISTLARGYRFDEKKKEFVFSKDFEKEDNEEDLSDKVRMARELQKVMNSIYSNLKFTVEVESDFINLRLPTLDCELFQKSTEDYNRQKLIYSFYEKEMNSILHPKF